MHTTLDSSLFISLSFFFIFSHYLLLCMLFFPPAPFSPHACLACFLRWLSFTLPCAASLPHRLCGMLLPFAAHGMRAARVAWHGVVRGVVVVVRISGNDAIYIVSVLSSMTDLNADVTFPSRQHRYKCSLFNRLLAQRARALLRARTLGGVWRACLPPASPDSTNIKLLFLLGLYTSLCLRAHLGFLRTNKYRRHLSFTTCCALSPPHAPAVLPFHALFTAARALAGRRDWHFCARHTSLQQAGRTRAPRTSTHAARHFHARTRAAARCAAYAQAWRALFGGAQNTLSYGTSHTRRTFSPRPTSLLPLCALFCCLYLE